MEKRNNRTMSMIVMIFCGISLVALFATDGDHDKKQAGFILTLVALFASCIVFYVNRPRDRYNELAKGLKSGKLDWFASLGNDNDKFTILALNLKKLKGYDNYKPLPDSTIKKLFFTGRVENEDFVKSIFQVLFSVKMINVPDDHYYYLNGSVYHKTDITIHHLAFYEDASESFKFDKQSGLVRVNQSEVVILF